MDEKLQAAADELTRSIQSHAEAASQDADDPKSEQLTPATHQLLDAIHNYTHQLGESTGAWVPWDVPEAPITPEDELFADDVTLEVIGRWRYVIPSVERLLAYVEAPAERLDGRPEMALYELLHARQHPLRWIAEDILQLDCATVGIFEGSDGDFVNADLPGALYPQTEVLFSYADLPRFGSEEEALAAARARADEVNADRSTASAVVREDEQTSQQQ